MIDELLIAFKNQCRIASVSVSPSSEEDFIETVYRRVVRPLYARVPGATDPLITWDLGQGFRVVEATETGISYKVKDGKPEIPAELGDHKKWNGRIAQIVEQIASYPRPAVFILLDAHKFLKADRPDETFARMLKNAAFSLAASPKRILLLGSEVKLPPDFEGLVLELQDPLPGAAELEAVIRYTLADQAQNYRANGIPFEDEMGDKGIPLLVRAAQGLTQKEVISGIGEGIMLAGHVDRLTGATQLGRVNDQVIGHINKIKTDKLKKLGVEFAPAPDVPVAGMDLFQDWVQKRTKIFAAQANSPNLPTPKGVMVYGLPGTGKSLMAKCLGRLWGIPTLKFDLGSCLDSKLGQSEANVRAITRLAEVCAPCILLVDEVDKAFGGATQGHQGDSGVRDRIFGHVLTWMQEKSAPVFIFFTANRVEGLPPELTRKGRLDEVWFAGLPNQVERTEILRTHLKRLTGSLPHGIGVENAEELGRELAGFSGAEIAGIVDEAAINAYADESTLDCSYLLTSISATVPLSKREPEKMAAMLAGSGQARPVSTPDGNPISAPSSTMIL